MTIPACTGCNKSYSEDEEYFRVFISQIQETYRHKASEWLLENRIIPRFKDRPKLASQIQSEFVRINVAGDVKYGLPYNAPRISRVVKKIVRGLYFLEKEKRIFDENINYGLLDEEFIKANKRILRVFIDKRFKVFGNNIFGYMAHFASSGNSVWLINFFDGITFYAITSQDVKL